MPIRLTLSFSGPDDPAAEFRRLLENAEIEIDCPRCRMATAATIGALRVETPVICMGCRITLRPTDAGALFDYQLRAAEQAYAQIFEVFQHG